MTKPFETQPVPESFKQEIAHRLITMHAEIVALPAVSRAYPEVRAALDFLRIVVTKFGFNARSQLSMVGGTLLPGQIAAKLSVEVPEADYEGWDYAVDNYRQENDYFAAMIEIAHEWEGILNNIQNEGNSQAYGFNVGFEEMINDQAQYQAIQEEGPASEMFRELGFKLERKRRDGYHEEWNFLQTQMERIFVRES
jgi:hypothetical protein